MFPSYRDQSVDLLGKWLRFLPCGNLNYLIVNEIQLIENVALEIYGEFSY